jgi:DNA-binding LacI/PurR family transcriptional regulator/DNA-binding transcriptional regulator YhcF (GntR family)
MTSGLKISGHMKAYQNIKAELCGRLARSNTSSGRLPPIRELARDLGVGQSSLQQAIRELVGQGLLISKPRVGTMINADPDEFLQEKEKTISQVPSPQPVNSLAQKWIEILHYRWAMAEQFYGEAVKALTSALADMKVQVTQDYLEMEHHGQLLERTQPDALVVINPTSTLNLTCSPSQILLAVSTTQHCNFCQLDRFDMVTIDEIQGGFMAGNYLKKMGWTDTCFMGIQDSNEPSRYTKASRDRFEGLCRGLGRSIPPEWQIRCETYDMIAGAIAVGEWLKLSPRPSAIFAMSDDLAFGFINGAMSHGLRPGRDYQIIGLDGQQMGKDLGFGTLTTVAVPMAEMGRIAATLLIERFNDPTLRSRRILLGCDLTMGNTVVPETSTV